MATSDQEKSDQESSGQGPKGQELTPERITRNLNELLQELRVLQTGVQILTGFLLTVPFSSRFEELEPHQRVVYLCVLVGSLLTTCLIVAPVAFHRTLFRRRKRVWLVHMADLCARLGLVAFSLVSGGVALLVFDVVAGLTAGWIAGVAVMLVFAAFWFGVPALTHRND